MVGDLGIIAAELAENREQKIRDHAFYRVNYDVTALQSPQIVDRASDMIDLAQRLCRAGRKYLAGRGQAYAPRKPLQEWHAEFMLEICHVPAKGRRGDMQIIGCGPNRTGSHDLQKVAQYLCVHEVPT